MSQVIESTAPTPARDAERPIRDIPLWLTAVILVLCIGGGSWLIWKYAKTNAPEPITIAPGNPRAPLVKNWRPSDGASPTLRTSRRNQDDDADGIKPLTPNRTWRVRAGNAYMHVSVNRKGDLEISPNYRAIYTPEQNQMVIMRQRLLQDDAMREFVKITPEQLQKLRSVPPPEGMKMAPDEQKKLIDLFQAYRAAKQSKDQEAAEKTLVAALDEIAKKRFEETRAYMVNRVQAIQAAVTPAQIKLFNDGPSNKPAAAPAPKPTAPALKAAPPAPKAAASQTAAPPAPAPRTPATSPASTNPAPARPG